MFKRSLCTTKLSHKYGRGLYASRDIKRGEVVEISPIIALDEFDAKKITNTIVNTYVFEWGKLGSAIALGAGSLFNHSEKSNVTYMNSFNTKEIIFMALKNVKKGKQLFINYGYDPLEGLMKTQRNKEIMIKYEDEDDEKKKFNYNTEEKI